MPNITVLDKEKCITPLLGSQEGCAKLWAALVGTYQNRLSFLGLQGSYELISMEKIMRMITRHVEKFGGSLAKSFLHFMDRPISKDHPFLQKK